LVSLIFANVWYIESCVVLVRGFSEGKSKAIKQTTNFGLAKTSNFLYRVLAICLVSNNVSCLNYKCHLILDNLISLHMDIDHSKF